MKSASRLAYFKPKKAVFADIRQQEEEEVDTNVISVHFSDIQEGKTKLRMGDPIFCKQCSSSISALSTSNIYIEAEILN